MALFIGIPFARSVRISKKQNAFFPPFFFCRKFVVGSKACFVDTDKITARLMQNSHLQARYEAITDGGMIFKTLAAHGKNVISAPFGDCQLTTHLTEGAWHLLFKLETYVRIYYKMCHAPSAKQNGFKKKLYRFGL